MFSFCSLAYHSSGVVTVQVVSSTGSHLGQTLFEYIDPEKPEKPQPSSAISGYKTPGIPGM